MKSIVTDGTLVEVTDKTWKKIKALLVLDKPEPKFEPIETCKFLLKTRALPSGPKPMVLCLKGMFPPDFDCDKTHVILSIDEMNELIKALQSAKAFAEANK